MDGVGGTVFDQESQEGENAANKKGDDDEVDDKEDYQPTTHFDGPRRYAASELRELDDVGGCQISGCNAERKRDLPLGDGKY